MGPNISKTISVTNIVNDVITNVMMENMSNCQSNNSSGQSITISGITLKGGCPLLSGGINQTINTKTDFTCLQSSDMSAEMQNKFATQLDQKIQTALSGLNLGIWNQSETQNYVNLMNRINVNVNMKNLASCIGSTYANQNITITNMTVDCSDSRIKDAVIKGGLSQVLLMDTTAKCTQSNSSLVTAINDLQNFIQQKIDTTNAGLNLDLSWIKYGLIFLAILALVIVAVVLGFNPISWIMRAFSD